MLLEDIVSLMKNDTRWNSFYIMLKCYADLNEFVGGSEFSNVDSDSIASGLSAFQRLGTD